MGYSGRLTIIIAIDRSIRMKYLLRYNSIMTKTKANLVLVVNGVLDIVQFAGTHGPHKKSFEMAYGIFHVICVALGCMLYIITYCNTQRQVSHLRSNMQSSQPITVSGAKIHSNEPLPPSQPETYGTAEGNFMHGCFLGTNRSETALDLGGPQERNSERNDSVSPSNASSRSNSLFREIPERSLDIHLSFSYDAAKDLPSRNSSITDHDQEAQDATSQRTDFHVKNERKTKNPKDTNHQKRSDSDVGRAMLFIVMVIVICYIPTLVEGLLRVQNIEDAVLDYVARILILINASCNAIILTVFSTDVRNLAKTLCLL